MWTTTTTTTTQPITKLPLCACARGNNSTGHVHTLACHAHVGICTCISAIDLVHGFVYACCTAERLALQCSRYVHARVLYVYRLSVRHNTLVAYDQLALLEYSTSHRPVPMYWDSKHIVYVYDCTWDHTHIITYNHDNICYLHQLTSPS